jgi:glycosyltransferase involved in cell wall biosynthesis
MQNESSENKVPDLHGESNSRSQPEIEVGLLTGGYDRPYVFGLATALESQGVYLDVVGGDDVYRPELHSPPRLNFLNLRGDQHPEASLRKKIIRVLVYYARLIRYTAIAKPRIFHILWNNKFHFFDRTLLMLYYKLQRKQIALTAHNVNAGKRDTNDSFLNRLSLKFQYHLADHIFVHTEKMKKELLAEFGVGEKAITVIPFGINNSVPDTCITPAQARQKLGISEDKKLILFFGNIGPYKGLDILVAGFQQVAEKNSSYRLIIAGNPRRGDEGYLEMIQHSIRQGPHGERVIQRIEYIPDEETELYFKAADVLVLPYTHVFQSGVLFLGYSFGLPVIATNVGSLEEDIIEGRTGFLCTPQDPIDLAKAIETYFESDLFKNLHDRRQEIRDFANQRHSWNIVAERTRNVYVTMLGRNSS